MNINEMLTEIDDVTWCVIRNAIWDATIETTRITTMNTTYDVIYIASETTTWDAITEFLYNI